MDSGSVECSIVDAHAPAAVLLFDQKNRRREGTSASLDQSCKEQFSHLFFDFYLFEIRVPVRPHINGFGVGAKGDVVGDGMGRGKAMG